MATGEWAAVELRKEQAGVTANKLFIRCAKKMAQIAYGKITVSPDPSAPLKKSIGTYDTGRFLIYFAPAIREVRRRKYTENYYDRYEYEPYCKAYTIRERKDYSDGQLVNCVTEKWKLGKFSIRSPKKFIQSLKTIEEHIDNRIKEEDAIVNDKITRDKLINDTRSKIKGLVSKGDSFYIGDREVRSNSGYGSINVTDEGQVKMRDLELTVDQFNELTKLLGWRKEDNNA